MLHQSLVCASLRNVTFNTVHQYGLHSIHCTKNELSYSNLTLNHRMARYWKMDS